jgi:uncharacterized protein (TIGR03437 family)
MKRPLLFFLLVSIGRYLLAADITLPKSMRLAGALNPAESQFGDEFYNFPAVFQGRAHPGATYQSGRIEFHFSPPVNNIAHFTLVYDGVGTDDGIVFPGGQTYDLLDNRVFNNPLLVNEGDLNLKTGEVTNFGIHSIFRNSTIARVTKNIRIPFGFVSDYPPVSLPIPLPFSDEPEISTSASFKVDSNGNITGFSFSGVSIAPVTLFPRLGIFPPFSFGDGGQFYFANPNGCLPDAPPQNCLNDQNNPNGVLLASNAFFHPHFALVSDELKEMPATIELPPCQLKGIASGNGLVPVADNLYQLGGFDGTGSSNLVQIYNPALNQWQASAPVPFPTVAAQSAALGSKIFVVGGFIPSTGAVTNQLQIYDTLSNTWSQGSPAPLAVSGGVAAQVGGKVYVIGGMTDSSEGSLVLTDRVQIYQPATDSWSSGSAAPLATTGSSAVVVGVRIYLINGRTGEDTVTNRVFIYDTTADAWQELAQTTPVGVYEAAAGYVNNRIYLMGGRRTVNGPSEKLFQTYELALNQWRNGLEPLLPVAASSAAVADGRLYIVGGRIMTGTDDAPGTVTDQVQIFDPGLGWSICDSHPLFTSGSVENSAAGVAAPTDLSPGTRASVLGFNFADSIVDAPPLTLSDGLSTDLPTTLAGISVSIDGKPAPILRVSPRQIDFQIPYDLLASPSKRRRVKLEIVRESLPPQAVQIPLLAAAPAIFIYNYGEFRYTRYLDGGTAVAQNQDGTSVYPNNPTHSGQVITLQMTGLGPVSPALENGERAGSRGPQPVLPLTATIGGIPATVVSAKLKTGDVGVYEVRVMVPANSPTGNNIPVTVTEGGVRSNTAVIAVR